MYESIGRRGGVARCPPLKDGKNEAKEKKNGTYGNGTNNVMSESPYWTNIQQQQPHNDTHQHQRSNASVEQDSDHDSAIYAELDKHSVASSRGEGADTPPTLPKSKVKRQAPPPPGLPVSQPIHQHQQEHQQSPDLATNTINKSRRHRASNSAGEKSEAGFAIDLSGEESEAVYTHV